MQQTTNISGVHISYYFVCRKKLWLYAHNIAMEQESELVSTGKFIDETSFSREKKNRMIDGIINIDFLKNGNIVHEVKKSDAFEEAHIWQIKYYIYYLKNKEIEVKKGVLHYPEHRIKKDIFLSQEDIKQLEQKIIPEIHTVINQDETPPVVNKTFCKKCSYYQLCYV